MPGPLSNATGPSFQLGDALAADSAVKIPLKGQANDFNLTQFLADNGLQFTGTSGSVVNRDNAVFSVKDKDGKESSFDAFKFLSDNGMQPDRESFRANQQSDQRATAQAAQDAQDARTTEELGSSDFGNYMRQTLLPSTEVLAKSDAFKNATGITGELSQGARTAMAVGGDVLSLIPRAYLGVMDKAKQILGREGGKDFSTSMASGAFPADAPVDPTTGQAKKTSLGDDWAAIKEAYRVDPGGVAADMIRENVGSPVTGLMLAGALTGGADAPAVGGEAVGVLARLAAKYKTIGAAAQAFSKPVQMLVRAQQKLQAAGALGNIVAKSAEWGVQGSLLGTMGKYAKGQEQDWNDFVKEGVESSAFGAAIAGLHIAVSPLLRQISAAWPHMNQEQQTQALNTIRARALLTGTEPFDPNADLGVSEPPAGSAAEERGSKPSAAPMTKTGAPTDPYGNPAEAQDAQFTPVEQAQGVKAGPSGLVPEGRTYEVVPGQGTNTEQGFIPVTDALPEGVSQKQVAKKMEDPSYVTQEDRQVRDQEALRTQKIQSDVKGMKKETEKLQEIASTQVQKALEDSKTEIEAEQKAALEASRKTHDALMKDADVLADPTTTTPFAVWNRLYGKKFTDVAEKQKAYEDFHVTEAKRAKAIKEKISPPVGEKRGSGGTADAGGTGVATQPSMADYQKAQDAIDAHESELAKVHGEKAVLDAPIDPAAYEKMGVPVPESPIPAEDLGKLKDLYATRDKIGDSVDEQTLNNVMSRVPADGPVKDPVVLKKILKDVQATANTHVAMGHKISPETQRRTTVSIFNQLSNHAASKGDFPRDLANDYPATEELVKNGNWRDTHGQNPEPIFKQAHDISNAIFGGQNEQTGVPDSGNGRGPQQGDGRLGGENRQGPNDAGGDRTARPGQPSDGNDGRNQPVVPAKPGDAREVAPVAERRPLDSGEAENLHVADQAAKLDDTTEIHEQDAQAPVPRAEVWSNVDLRDKAPIVLSKGQRIEYNRRAKDIVEAWTKDPSSVTNEDREILRHYTGQGGLGAKADEDASEGILNQHYTSYQVIRFAWDLLRAAGFPMERKLTALEPAAGIGNFVGHRPPNVDFYANEVDETSAKILQILYPRNVVNRSGPFESYIGPKVHMVLTNVPFLKGRGAFAYLETDPQYKAIGSLHNYFLMKGLDNLLDNGVGLFLTSTGTMDAGTGEEFRKSFNLKAEVMTAFRLPAGTFTKNTGYEGSVDMILVRKRTKGEIANGAAEDKLQPEFVGTNKVKAESKYGTTDTYRTKWYDAHPDNVLGRLTHGEARGLGQSVVKLDSAPGEAFETTLAGVFGKALAMAKDIYSPQPGAELDEQLSGYGDSVGRAKEETPVFGLEVRDGKVLRKDKLGELRPFRPETNEVKGKAKPWDIPEKRFAQLVELMESADELRKARGRGEDVKPIQEHIKTQLQLWADGPKYPRQPMVKVNGAEHPAMPGIAVTRKKVNVGGGKFENRPEVKFRDNALEAYVAQDRRWSLVRGLYNEKLTGYSRSLTEPAKLETPPTVAKGDMSTARGVVDYLLKTQGVFREDLARAEFKGTDEEFNKEMRGHPDLNWTGDRFEHDDEYLQGNLREKIAFSKEHSLKKQLAKLEAALPEQKTPMTVPANPISTWWDGQALTDFARDARIVGSNHRIQRFTFGLSERFQLITEGSSPRVVDIPSHDYPRLQEFVANVLNQRPLKVPDPSGATNEDGPIMVADHKASQALKEKWNKEFEAWTRAKGQKHADTAATRFNDEYGSMSTRKDAETPMYISNVAFRLNGRELKPYPAQFSLVRRALRQFGYIAAHGVGHGKTMGSIMTFAELRNQGRIKSAVFVVPGNNRGMWHSNITQIVPDAKVKIIAADGAQRRADLVDAANNHYDAVLLSYDTFKTIPLAKAEEYIRQDMDLYNKALKDMMSGENKAAGKDTRLRDGQVKRLEEKLAKLENKLHEIQQGMKDPLGVTTFEDLQPDAMFMDEAHKVKNSFEQMNEYADRSFLNQNSDSHIGNDMVYKTKYLHEKNGRGGAFLLTATPTPNNPLEIYKIIKLVAPWEWTSRGINTVDDFIRNFVQIGPIEVPGLDAVAGRTKEGVTGWQNLRALRSIINTWMDFRKDSEDVKKPDVIPRQSLTEMTDEQLNQMAEIMVQSELSVKEMMELGINHLSLTTRAKQLGVDPAMVDVKLVDKTPNFMDRSPKLREVMKNTERHFKADPDGNQIIFLDNFRINDFYPMRDENNELVSWPRGLGYLGSNSDGTPIYPSWIDDLSEEKANVMKRLLTDSHGVTSGWPRELMNPDGTPKKITPAALERMRPQFDEDTGAVHITNEGVRVNLHDEMRRYAIDKIGMKPERVYVVNGGENAKPEDKTRLEAAVADGLVSLIIGNSPSLAEGLNLQNRGRAIHHVDVPWTPKEFEQRNGRMWRTRTEEDSTPLTIYNYLAQGSMDAKGYTIIHNKAEWQRELFTGKADFMDNSINNIEQAGFSYKDYADAASVNSDFVAGYRMMSGFMREQDVVAAQMKEGATLKKGAETQLAVHAEAHRIAEDAEDKIAEGHRKAAEAYEKVQEYNKLHPDKPKALPEPYDDKYYRALGQRNIEKAEAAQKNLQAYEEKLKAFEKLYVDAEINRRGMVFIKEVRAHKWKTQAGSLGAGSEAANFYNTFLQGVMPDMYARSALLADMVATKALGHVPTKETAEADSQKLLGWIKKVDSGSRPGQAGGVNAKLMGVLGGTAIAFASGHPGAFALGAAGLGVVHAFRKAWRADIGHVLAYTIRGRLRFLPGWSELEPKFERYNLETSRAMGRDYVDYRMSTKNLTDDEKLQAAAVLEGKAQGAPQNIRDAAKAMQQIFKRVAANTVGTPLEIAPDAGYFPRFLDFDMIQKMKADPAEIEEVAKFLVDTQGKKLGWGMEEAVAYLQNHFDGTDEMRGERNRKEQERLSKWIMSRFPDMTPEQYAKIYNNIKARFGAKVSGNLKYGRIGPELPEKYYKRNVDYVMSRYIPGAWRSIMQHKVFGENNAAINAFLHRNYPQFGGEPSEGREQVKAWFRAQLHEGRFGSLFQNVAGGGKGLSWAAARKITAFQFWTKLALSPNSPVRNLAATWNMIVPLAGVRNSMMAYGKTMKEVLPGTNVPHSTIASALSDRLIRDAYDFMKGGEDNSFVHLQRVLKYDMLPFTMTEKFNRVLGYNAGVYYAERLFREAQAGGTKGRKSGAILARHIGDKRLQDAFTAGELGQAAKDMMGIHMTEKVNGTTRAFDLPEWMNTPEGSVIMQFRRLQVALTVTWTNDILKPAFKGNFAPLLKWAAACGISIPVVLLTTAALPLLASILTGSTMPEQQEKEVAPGVEMLKVANSVNLLGNYGDIIGGLNSGDEFGDAPLVGTLVGPTISSMAHLASEVGYHGIVEGKLFEEGQAAKMANTALRREIPFFNMLSKAGIFGDNKGPIPVPAQ